MNNQKLEIPEEVQQLLVEYNEAMLLANYEECHAQGEIILEKLLTNSYVFFGVLWDLVLSASFYHRTRR